MHLQAAKVGIFYPLETYREQWKKGENGFSLFAQEVLEHAGVTFKFVERGRVTKTDVDVLVVSHASLVEQDDLPQLIEFVQAGGTVVQFGGAGALGKHTGLVPLRRLSAGYAKLPEADEIPEPLKFLSGESLSLSGVESVSAPLNWRGEGEMRLTPEGPALQPVWYEAPFEKGWIAICAVDVFKTMVFLQQGDQPVRHDGAPAPDGTAPLDDGILKAEDTLQQDWEWDRRFTPSGGAYFAFPYSDLWREAVVRCLVKWALRQGYTIPVIGYWPAGVKAVAHLSHDSDLNIDASAETTLDLLKPFAVNSTWCMMEPGYSPHIYERVKEAGHELALHYNALEEQNGKWDRREFRRQYHWLKEVAALDGVTSNKNHYTRFEGWGELFAWCEECGIEVDQTRGPSKGGDRGFVFATCHPYKPIAWHDEDNRIYDLLEIGFLTQDLDLSDYWGKSDIVFPLLDQVERVEGVAHFLFHQVHIHNSESVRKALKTLLAEAIQRGMPWWTSQQINRWERARRSVRIEKGSISAVEAELDVTSDTGLKRGVIHIPLEERAEYGQVTRRWGVPCLSIVTDIAPGTTSLKMELNQGEGAR
jgi:hypothetical protein